MQAERHASLRARFQRFARVEAPDLDSPMYSELASGVYSDDELLAIAGHAMPGQPAPNMLFAAVQYLLLSGVDHPLAAHYPIMAGGESRPAPAFSRFRDFCLQHRESVVELVRTRRTQTNVVRRCTCLLPAFSLACRDTSLPLALIDLGASAGLNLNFDRYAYSYRRDGLEVLRWGPARAKIRLEAELRGAADLPPLPAAISVASRDAIDLDPVDLDDPDQLLWLRALIWPEHVERHQQLIDAAGEMDQGNIRMHGGDAAVILPSLLESVPFEHAPVVYSTIAFYQFPRESRRRISRTLAAASGARPVWQIALEGLNPKLSITRYRDGTGETEILADVSAHGWWIDWRTGGLGRE
ncbi:MAG: DUF2332 domain-containing protein [Rhodospirillaceae bacterium]|nr:DUF2332 domain-containing protein [Rhodospirillaceae bacterium]